MFQSTPAIADGRTLSLSKYAQPLERFQSTPAIADGRTTSTRLRAITARRFQSTPAIADGRTLADLREEHAREVSIHARHR